MPSRSFRPLYVMAALLSMGYGFIFTMLGELRDTFGFSDTGVGAIAAAGFLAGFLAQSTLARYADRGHGRTLLRVGMAAAVAGSVWMCVADEVWQFTLARMLAGIGSGASAPVLRRVVILRDPDHVGRNMGTLTSAEMVGFVCGPALAGILVGTHIRLPFVVLACAYGLVGLLALRIESPPARGGLGGAVNRRLLAMPGFQGALASGAAFFAVIGLWEATWSLMLGDLGADTAFIGITLSLFTVPMIFLAPRGGRIAQSVGPLRLARVTTLVAAATMVAYGAAGEMRLDPVPENPPVDELALAILLTLSLIHAIADSFTMPANQVAVAVAAPAADVAAAQGLFSACGLLVSFAVAAGGTALYDTGGPFAAFLTIGVVMASCVVVAGSRAPDLFGPIALDASAELAGTKG